jgi:hypothetical protein
MRSSENAYPSTRSREYAHSYSALAARSLESRPLLLDGLTFGGGETSLLTDCTLRFAPYGDVPDETGRYVVTVHVDLQGQRRLTRGDYLSVESSPVLTPGNPDHVSLHVREVT